MNNYKDILWEVYDNGLIEENRTGIDTKAIFGFLTHIPLHNGFPLVTLRPTSFKIVFEETMFFLKGETDTKKLEEKKVNIWKGNTSREFLDSRGLTHLREGNMGKGYGYQWRSFGDVTDQIKNVFNSLKNNPYSRRHLVSAWNPNQLDEMALPPCHSFFLFNVTNDKLSTLVFLRSNDVPYGAPYNIAQYALINKLFASALGYKSEKLVYTIGNAHYYMNQENLVKEIMHRQPYPMPTLDIKKDLNSLEDILNLEYEDLQINNYQHHPDIENKPEMAI